MEPVALPVFIEVLNGEGGVVLVIDIVPTVSDFHEVTSGGLVISHVVAWHALVAFIFVRDIALSDGVQELEAVAKFKITLAVKVVRGCSVLELFHGIVALVAGVVSINLIALGAISQRTNVF